MKVRAIGKKVTMGNLAEFSTSPDVDGFMLVGFMRDGTTSIGWSDTANETLAFGMFMLRRELDKHLDEQESYE